MFPTQTILCPIDFSPATTAVLRYAWSLAHERRSRLLVMHVVSAQAPVDCHEDSRRALAEIARRFRFIDDTVPLEVRVDEGDPATEILFVSQELRCALIVMGVKGKGQRPGSALGSVAEVVVRSATCPVLVVKLPDPTGVSLHALGRATLDASGMYVFLDEYE